MHYANGRPAKNGDKVVQVVDKKLIVGVLYDAVAGNNFCNGQLAPIGGGQHILACLIDCIHLDDILALLKLDLTKGDVRSQLEKIPYNNG